jgi:hypothetical protein
MKFPLNPLVAGTVLLVCSFFPAAIMAIVTLGDDLEFEGFVKAQNILRTPRFDTTELIMQRNTAQIESKYYFLRDKQVFGRFSTGPLEEGTLTLTGRSVYDSIYDIRGSYSDAFSNADKPFGKSEHKLREAFVDLVLPPFSLRLGRQQVVWGETDNFRALDVINPLDLTWHWARESWEDIRIPLWMARGIYDVGKFGPLEESFVEGIWIPADFKPNKITTDPRRPWAFTGDGLAETANAEFVGGRLHELNVAVRDLSPRRKLKNGQAGMRFKAILGEIDFSLNYFYGYSADTGVRVRSELDRINGNVLHRSIDLVNPRTHVVGLTANYSDERFTQSVFRLETAFTTGVPVRIAAGAPLEVDPEQDQFETARRSVVMVAIDRPTWIRPLNPSRTFFLSTQIFWRRYLDYSSQYRGFSTVEQASVGGALVPETFLSASNDEIDQNEFVITFVASTSYGDAGLLQPQFVFAIDPRSTGAYNRLAFDYIWSNHVIIRLQQDLYWNINNNDPGPWALGDVWGNNDNNSRHETILSLIFQF